MKSPAILLRCSFFLLLLAPAVLQAQSQRIKVSGKVSDLNTGKPLQYAFVVIHRTQNGIFCDSGGRFSLEARPNDTLLISQTGYLIEKIFLSNYPDKDSVHLNLALAMKPVQLKTFTIKAPKTFEQILADLETEERKKAGKSIPLADAINSPITYLYQQFSRQEQSRQKIAALRSEEAKKALFRELFTRYMLAHIIDLDENEMDEFILWSQIGEAYQRFETEYDLVVFVKEKFRLYRREQEK